VIPNSHLVTGALAPGQSLTVQVASAVVPEPSTLTLAGIGVLALMGYARRHRRSAR
jgi:hypothetical protein